jgi:hypothetical protein
MVRTFEDLALFGNGMDDGFERRSAIGDAKRTALDLADDLGDTAPDRTKILQPLVPQEPASIGRARIVTPTGNEPTHKAVVILFGSYLIKLRGHVVVAMPPSLKRDLSRRSASVEPFR